MEEIEKAHYRIALAVLSRYIGEFTRLAGREMEVPPEKPLQGWETKVIKLADLFSAGEHVPAVEQQLRQLRPIFCSLTVSGQQAPAPLYYPLAPLRMEEEIIFPTDAKEDQKIREAYFSLVEGFSREAGALLEAHERVENLPVYLESLLLLFQRYAWCVPSVLPDVSLYDHSRVAAALAVCLLEKDETTLDQVLAALEEWHQARQENGSAPVPTALEKVEVALLVGGDISGVQDFIYTITARGATSALRGRSLYLQLLTEAVARYAMRSLDLPITNLLYQGGGGFYLLARPSDREKLEEVRRNVSRILLAHHRGDLYLALGAVPLFAADFYDGRISIRWRALGECLQKAKQCRFAELGDELPPLFAPEGHGGSEDLECQVCGREHPATKKDDDVRKCLPCRSYEELGDALRRARYLWMAEVEPSVPKEPLKVQPGGWDEVLAAFGMKAGLVEKAEAVPASSGPRWILALKDEAMESLKPGPDTVIGRRFLVNVTPILTEAEYRELQGKVKELPKPGSIKSFDVLEYQSTGIKRLGVLRMDVDDLGKLFSDGLGEKATFSRVAALSFAISLFFEGWVEILAERIGKAGDGRERLYSIYSGGDDLFFVGSWDAVVELARAIRADLSRFAAGHPGVHASTGIALVGGKYPLYQAAEDARKAEERAKSFRQEANGGALRKNAICFLGQVVPWSRFGLEECREGMETVHALAHLLERLTRPEEEGGAGAPKALLQMLIRLHEQYQEVAEARARLGEDRNWAGKKQTYYGPWMWRGYYFLRRMARRYEKESPEIARAVDNLAELLHMENFGAIEWIGLAARWAELLGRD